MLIIFSGLPGSGKSTIARALAQRLGAVYLRIDTIEQAIRDAERTGEEMGPAGYFVAYGLARENLALGSTVITDSVNPIQLTRDAYHDIARSVGCLVSMSRWSAPIQSCTASGSKTGRWISRGWHCRIGRR